jgi:hypothetical protein
VSSLRRPAVVVLVVLAAAAFGAVGGHTDAGAAAPSRQGWWKIGLPIADVGIGGVGNLKDPQGADVPDGGLLVQGGQSVAQPAAYAAVGFDLGSGAVGGPLRLVPAPSTVSAPGSKLIACPLVNATFQPADGGDLTNGPSYSCASAVSATVDSSGAYVFDVAGLHRGDSLGVAILPTMPTDRVVFAKPGDGTLPVNESSSAAGADLTAPHDVGGIGSDNTPALAADIGGVAAPAPLPSLSESAQAASGTPTASAALPAARAAAATHRSASTSSPTSYVPYLLAGLLGLAAVLWIGAGSSAGAGEPS